MALTAGHLSPDGRGGAGLLDDDNFTPVRWPDGYTIVQQPELQLRDPGGRTIAIEGDTVYVGGGQTGPDDTFVACGYVSRDPP
jgi:hypothetical protein